MNLSALVGKANSSPKVTLGATAGALLVLTLAVWLMVVSPQRSHASDLDSRIAETEAQLANGRTHSNATRRIGPREMRDLLRALPDRPRISRVVRELDSLARATNVTLDSVTPLAPAVAAAYQAVPLTVVVDGAFLDVRAFMLRLRTQVRVRGERVRATGRLYDVQSIDFQQSTEPRPNVRATLTMQAFVHSATAPSAGPTGVPGTTASATGAGN
jgi:Tfp pilus assembly protein PilO